MNTNITLLNNLYVMRISKYYLKNISGLTKNATYQSLWNAENNDTERKVLAINRYI